MSIFELHHRCVSGGFVVVVDEMSEYELHHRCVSGGFVVVVDEMSQYELHHRCVSGGFVVVVDEMSEYELQIQGVVRHSLNSEFHFQLYFHYHDCHTLQKYGCDA
jgi:hypothetical protein